MDWNKSLLYNINNNKKYHIIYKLKYVTKFIINKLIFILILNDFFKNKMKILNKFCHKIKNNFFNRIVIICLNFLKILIEIKLLLTKF